MNGPGPRRRRRSEKEPLDIIQPSSVNRSIENTAALMFPNWENDWKISAASFPLDLGPLSRTVTNDEGE